MNTKAILTILLLTHVLTTSATDFETATSAVTNMRVGWNLGNTLDSNSGDINNMWIEKSTSRRTSDYETAWGQPITKPQLFQMFKQAGFNAIRVPVTWYPHMQAHFTLNGTAWDPENDDIGTKIQTQWITRVHQVVDYVVSQGMYCILNIHHDTGAANTAWLVASENDYAQQKERFEEVWRQIAQEFKDYDQHLIFEAYNEMLDPYHSWCFASFAAPSNYDADIANSAYNAINSYAQSFVDVVRSTGGNNAQRNLIVSTYGACCGSGTWNTHLQDPLKNMQLPTDIVSDHLIFEVHSYPDIKDLNTAKSEVRQTISVLKKHLVSKGAPVIFGEWGTSTDAAYDNYRDNMLDFAHYFVQQAKASNIATFYWMGLSDGAHRSVPEFNQTDLKDAIIKGYYGDEGYTHITTRSTSKAPEISACYNLQGCRISFPQQGINIIRMTDGTSRKISRHQ